MATKTCTRPSTLSKEFDKISDSLMDYQAATVLEAVLANADLHNQAILTNATSGWRAYKPVVDEAKRRRGKVEASEGTNVHSAVVALYEGRDVSRLPDEVVLPARAVLDLLARSRLTIVDQERFCGTPDTFPEAVAGTFDIATRSPATGKLAVVDIKTVNRLGAVRYSALKWAMQLACYANSRPFPHDYVPDRDGYGRPVVDFSLAEEWPGTMTTERGLVVEVVRGTTEAQLHVLDLKAGAQAVDMACRVRALRKRAVAI